MSKRSNVLVLILMASSIILLLVLQLFWLRSAWEDAFHGLRRESNYIFRSTLFSLRDSLSLGNILPVTADTADGISARDIRHVNIITGDRHDSLPAASASVQVIVSPNGNTDSLLNAIRHVTAPLTRGVLQGQRRFLLRLSLDTIHVDTLTRHLSQALRTAGIPLSFTLQHRAASPDRMPMFAPPLRSGPGDKPALFRSDSLRLENIRMGPGGEYEASVFPVQGYLLRQILPQVLFSLFLMLITLAAFTILYRNLRSQQRLMALKNDFISNITHELKTPVATVSVVLEALKDFHGLQDTKRTEEYLAIAQYELSRLTLMTDSILKTSAFEEKGIVLQKETVDLRRITEDVLSSLMLVFEKQQATVIFRPAGDDFTIEGEADHLANVLYNLLDNALKYSVGKPVVTIELNRSEEEVILSVRDEGQGIPAEYRKKIFEKFFRVPTGNVHNTKGYGLGLSYVAGVVEAHGGCITVESQPGSGSTFVIHWPKAQVHL